MNIGFFYGMQTYPPTTGGTVHGYQLVRQLVANGHKLSSWYFGNHNDPDVNNYRGRELISFLRKIDLIYIRVEWEIPSAVLSLLRLLKLNKTPVVWEINGTPDELLFAGRSQLEIDKINSDIKRWSAYCSGAIAVTQDIADYARRTLGVSNTITIPNGSDPDMFSPGEASIDDQRPLEVVWLGTSSAGWHDLPCLLEAARILEEQRSNVQIRIFGDKKPLSNVQLPSNVSLEGAKPYVSLADHLATADVGIHLFKVTDGHPAVKGSPLKLFDYMACGLALVVNSEGQQNDIIEKYRSGLRCDPTPAAVARTLMSLERDRAGCARMGAQGREAVITEYNWRNTGKATSDFLEAVLANRHL